MADEAELLLKKLRTDERAGWVAVQLASSFARGLSMNVAEISDQSVVEMYEPEGITVSERKKRERYETTRPYVDSEKLQLIREAIYNVFVVLPAIQKAAIDGLRSSGSRATAISFMSPDEVETPAPDHHWSSESAASQQDQLAMAYKAFDEVVRDGNRR